ncbi:hypothetical protein GP486_003615 [Trichoglossum hirsutum]|uniref:Non-haem dioxygenase N-terminal domain-containing protein n=1 Tax=Trichoglossum hirsutum TaxID=265104 RepID=A0A9P8LCW8_9PEZI|nr:hypothetical protein GP486_003615 [Trichoglossum hirsutum]
MSSFTEIPILDLSLARSPDTKPRFLKSLRHALLEVGFLYIKNAGIEDDLVNDVIEQGKAFFDLPMEAKLEIEMKNVHELNSFRANSEPDSRRIGVSKLIFLRTTLFGLQISLSTATYLLQINGQTPSEEDTESTLLIYILAHLSPA